MHIQSLKAGGGGVDGKKNLHDYFLPRAKTSGVLKRTEMTLNILEDDVQGIFSKNPLRTQKSKAASTTVINAPFKKRNNNHSSYRGKNAHT